MGFIESPTGTGKSMSILCSALTLRDKIEHDLRTAQTPTEAEEQNKEEHSKAKQNTTLGATPTSPSVSVEQTTLKKEPPTHDLKIKSEDTNTDPVPTTRKTHDVVTLLRLGGKKGPVYDPSADADEFCKPKKAEHKEMPPTASTPPQTPQEKPVEAVEKSLREKLKPPLVQVVYGTRTHSQVAQLAAEVRRSGYHPRIALYGSRSRLCLNEQFKDSQFVDENCQTSKGKCKYKRVELSRIPFVGCFLPGGRLEAWDLDDLKLFCEAAHICPYYAAREFGKVADLVLCPYNHIISSGIRSAYGINLERSIVIIDEAHNIDDALTSTATLEISESAVDAATTELDRIKTLPEYSGIPSFIFIWTITFSRSLRGKNMYRVSHRSHFVS